MLRLLVLTFAVVLATAWVHPADSVETRLRGMTERFAAMDAVLDRAYDGPSVERAIRELDRCAIPGLNRAYGNRVLREASAEVRVSAELAEAEARQRLGRRLSRWYDDGWLTPSESRRSPFLRTVMASFRREAEANCEAISKESNSWCNRGICYFPDVDELHHMMSEASENPRMSKLWPAQFLNPWGGRYSMTVVDTPTGSKPVVFAKVLTEQGWDRVDYPVLKSAIKP